MSPARDPRSALSSHMLGVLGLHKPDGRVSRPEWVTSGISVRQSASLNGLSARLNEGRTDILHCQVLSSIEIPNMKRSGVRRNDGTALA